MAISRLGTDYGKAFSRLCHLAALTRTGKTAAAIDGLVVSTWAIDPAQCDSVNGLGDAIAGYFGLRLPQPTLQLSRERLISAGRLVPKEGSEGYDLARFEQESFQERARSAQDLRDSVRANWLAEVAAESTLASVSADDLWKCLETYTAAVFQRHGIHAIELLGGVSGADGDGSLQSFLASAIATVGLASHGSAVSAAIRLFFAEAAPDKTRYLAGLLDATFTYFAIAVDDITSDYLRDSLQPLKIFVDTNVLFGVLELSEDYFAGIARQLVSMVKEGKLPFILYFHERTIREFRDTVDATASDVCRNRWTQELSRAAVRYGEETGALRSAELAYHRQNAQTRTPPEVFFSKYDHLERLLADLGFRIYREAHSDDPEAVKTKGLLIAEYEAFVQSERAGRPRRYEARDHDVVVWLTVHRLRKSGAPPLESGAIFLTNDYLLSRFERRRLQAPHDSASVVVAAQFVQVLRPFVPSTDDFDRGFVENLALPEFQVAHGDYREVGEQVLGYLATYSGLEEGTALAVLSDEILRHQVGNADPGTSTESLVESAIVRENARLREENKSLHSTLREVGAGSALSSRGITPQLNAPEAIPGAGNERDLVLDAVAAERDRAVRELKKLRRQLKRIGLTLGLFVFLAVVWLGPIVASNAPILGELGQHSHRLPIQIIVSLAAPLALVAVIGKERIPVWLAIFAVAAALVVAIAQLL